MSGLAEIALNLSFSVSGSDLKESDITKRLRSLGAKIYIGQEKEHIGFADTVVVSSAIPKENHDLISAKNKGLKILKRAEFLSFLTKMKKGIAITGAHGKTTTSSLISFLLQNAGLDPTAIIGGVVKSFGSNAKLGKGEFLVCEADESDGSFLSLFPKIAVVTNIDKEHMDYFKNTRRMKEEYLSFINRVPKDGLAILCSDNKYIKSLLRKINVPYKTYGLNGGSLSARNIKQTKEGVNFEVINEGTSLGNYHINLLGKHNVLNSLAVVGVGLSLCIPPQTIKESLEAFSGVERRLDIKRDDEIMVISDYGHHPTEIKATIKAIKTAFKRHLIVVFQPHRYTRTKYLISEFANAFNLADRVILTEIYPASEAPIEGVSGEILYKKVAGNHHNVSYIPDFTKIPEFLKTIVKYKDVILVLGAGNINSIVDTIMDFHIKY